MELIEDYKQKIQKFKVDNALDATEENVATTFHLMNTHKIDKAKAFEQSSRGANDYGIDGWHHDDKQNHLYIYQSKFSENKGYVLTGLKDMLSAINFLGEIFLDGELDKTPSNNSIYNLYMALSKMKDGIKKISFILISPLNENYLLDSPEFEETGKLLGNSRLNKFINEKGGKILPPKHVEYDFEEAVPTLSKKYPIKKLEDSVIKLRDKAYLEITFIPLYSLVLLYRQRGDMLFEKNVRLSLYEYTDTKNKVATPMEKTLGQICEGQGLDKLSPNIFPFYHVGITISATTNASDSINEIELETPHIINGCQTITIADRFLRNLENKKAKDAIEIFKNINVLAKVVIGTNDEELKEITNCNNRQNPIENWQLFANDPIQIEIGHALTACEVLYERQKGQFKLLKKVDVAKNYSRTNKTFIEVEKLGQIISLVCGQYQFAAKPSLIFVDKQKHDSIFTKDIPKYPRDIILCHNLLKAAKTGLTNYLQIPTHRDNQETLDVFQKPIVKTYVHRAALLFHYQRNQQEFKFASWLYQKASPNLVDDFEKIYARIISKTRNFYLNEQKNSKEVPSKKLTAFFDKLYVELGIDTENKAMPFTKKSIDWTE